MAATKMQRNFTAAPKPKCKCGVRFANGVDKLCNNCREFKRRSDERATRAAK